jgi:hypothetical protein
LLVGQIAGVKVLSQLDDFFPNDPTKTAKISFVDGGEFFMQGIDCRKFTVFELDLLFENARIKILDSGSKIEVYAPTPSNKYLGYTYLNLEQTIVTQIDLAMDFLYQNVADFLWRKAELISPLSGAFTEALYA